MKLALAFCIPIFVVVPTPHANRPIPSASPSAAAHAPGGPPHVGDAAPDFDFQAVDHAWRRFHEFYEQGDVLLVFGATDAELVAIERSSDALLAAGVVPIAIVGDRDADAWKRIERGRLTYSLLSDPRGDLAGRFGVVDATGRARFAWLVIDRSGRVRGVGDARPAAAAWPQLASSALGRSEIEAASTH